MKALIGLLAVVSLATTAAAQSLVPTANNGAVVAPGALAPRIQLQARDVNGLPRAGVTVVFDGQCTYRARGDFGPYACVTTAEPLVRVTDGSGNVLSPLYQADLFTGNAWIIATANVDGRVITLPLFLTVGNGPVTPLRIVSGNGQAVQINSAAQPLVARVVDDFNRGMGGVPVQFASDCSGTLPCLRPATGATKLVSDSQGNVESGVRVANANTGSYSVRLSVLGSAGGVNYSLSNILPTRTAIARTRTGEEAFIRLTDAPTSCAIARWERMDESLVAPRPFMVAMPQGLIELFIDNCPAGAEIAIRLQHPGGFPEGSNIWAARPAWHTVASTTTIEGFWDFTITDGGPGDGDSAADGRIRAVLSVGYGDPSAPDFQDLWWVGYQENGWGISITQHRDTLFVIVFAYDEQGEPTWYVMPGGSWNATRNTYTGVLYSPRGRPLYEHVAANLVPGAPVGSLALLFDDTMNARAIFQLGGVETIKLVKRQFFGVRDERVTGRYADIWWAGPERSGWGFVLQQQFASMFALTFTYGTDGKPTWYTMPSITQASNLVFSGPVHKTKSSTWPTGYDPNLLEAPDVGEFRVEFNAAGTGGTFDFITQERADRFSISRQPF